ncbi:MAG: NADPH:quinone reductase [Spirochaetes bacterium GWD1_27_9]|nr:MAG: NADPH:quinone reductase [Spirochaetes bacterium GWB1_27_13]OHD20832.1 MAG: NADPH:quinone reductase [Spirochaetes bacterium GWC1_27_15]OHD30613.1 MAG: NADPH:quinone reductase [Spirochaetes bacterium GWD1_27_9]
MKAVICTNYGVPEVLKIKEVEKPKPRNNEILIKIIATSAHIGDTRIRRVDPFLVRLVFGLFKPKNNLILGLEVSGVIESVGKDVTLFMKGDEVFAFTGFNLGGYAEYICLPERVKYGERERKGLVAIKPKNLSYEEASVIPAGALTALKNLQKVNIKDGQKILINGASGSLGTYAIQLAKYFGAEVTAVCSAKNFEMVKSIGADKVIDYEEEDFTKIGTKYDIVYDAVMKSKHSQCKKILTPSGVFLNNNNIPKIKEEDLFFLKDLVEQNKLKPIIDKIYSLDEIVEAHRYVDTGHKRGNVSIQVAKDYVP